MAEVLGPSPLDDDDDDAKKRREVVVDMDTAKKRVDETTRIALLPLNHRDGPPSDGTSSKNSNTK